MEKIKDIVIVERVDEDGNVQGRYTRAQVCDSKPSKMDTIPSINMVDIFDAFEDFCKTLEWN